MPPGNSQKPQKFEPTTLPPVSLGGPAVEPPPPPTPKPRKHRHPLIAVAVLIVIIIGAGTFAILGRLNSPERILADAVINSLQTKRVAFNGAYTVDSTEVGGVSTAFDISGAVDSINQTAKIDASFGISPDQITFSAVSETDTTYFKVDGLNELSSALALEDSLPADLSEALTTAIDELNDQWIVLDTSPANVINVDDQLVSDESIDQLIEIYKNNQFLEINEVLDDQEVNGRAAYHYSVTVDRQELENFLVAVEATADGNDLTDEAFVQLDELIDNLEGNDISMEVWVDKADIVISKILLGAESNGDQQALVVTFENYGVPVTITPPTETITLAEAFNILVPVLNSLDFGGLFNLPTDSEVDLDLIPSVLEAVDPAQ